MHVELNAYILVQYSFTVYDIHKINALKLIHGRKITFDIALNDTQVAILR